MIILYELLAGFNLAMTFLSALLLPKQAPIIFAIITLLCGVAMCIYDEEKKQANSAKLNKARQLSVYKAKRN